MTGAAAPVFFLTVCKRPMGFNCVNSQSKFHRRRTVEVTTGKEEVSVGSITSKRGKMR